MPNADRVSEVYRGRQGSRTDQARARRRIDWLVGRAHGRVLDVGCSQGVVSILCARLGLDVLGVDTEQEAIDYALAERERKPATVRDRLEFRLADASDLELPDASFDTVLLGDVLEHAAEPDRVLAEAGRVVKPDGLVAVTVPFGFMPNRRTFLVASLVKLVARHLTIESLEIEDGSLRVHAAPGAMDPADAGELVLRAQPRLEETVTEIHREHTALRRRRSNLIRRARRLRQELADRELANRRLRWRLATVRRSRSSRALRALAEVRRHPGKILGLPRELFRALRTLLPLEKPAPKPPIRRVRAREILRTAEAMEGHDQRLAVELPEAAPLPEGPIARPDLRVATILDRFSALAFRYEWDQVEVGPDDWRERLSAERPELLFVESAWKGNSDRWARALAGHGEGARQLADLVAWCRDAGIPTAFWNKEDPPHFETFLPAASLFDHVFTTDSDRIPRYQEALGHERVSVLSFGAQPRVHNPVAPAGGRRYDVAFAGTYLRHKHPARRAQMDAILGSARDRGLHIFSRVQSGESVDLEWPDEFLPYIVGSLPYERMVTAYKAYRLFLNVNSVIDSPTMCARRAFEISATSTPLLSGDSVALRAVFGDLISVASTADEARVQLDSLLGDPELAARRGHEAMRHVLAGHTYGHRVDEILRVAEIDGHFSPDRPTVSAVVGASEPSAAMREQLAAQSHPPHEVLPAPKPGGIASAAKLAAGELLAVVAPGPELGEHLLEDLAGALAYTDAQVIGKPASHDGPAHSYTLDLHRGVLLTTTALAREIGFDQASDDPVGGFLAACRKRGVRGYATDRYSFSPSPARAPAA